MTLAPALERYFLDYQRAWILDESRAKLCEKSRRIGWTYASSFRRVWRALAVPRLDAWWMTRDLVTAQEFIRYCRFWCELARAAAEGLEGECQAEADPVLGLRTQAIEFRNGSRILVLSSNPDAAAGKGGDLGLDEFALHQRQERLYQVARPVVMWGYQLEIISTHRGAGSVFNRLVQSARGDNPMGWSHYRVSIQEAVAAGLVDRINEGARRRGQAEQTPEAFLEQERAGCLSESMWRQEYLCEPAEADDALLNGPMLADALCSWAALEEAARTARELGRPRAAYLGMDVGRQHDRSILWLVEAVDGVLYTRELIELCQVPFQAQLARLLELAKRWSPRLVALDAGGLGAMLAEEAGRHLGVARVLALQFTVPLKEALALGLLRELQARRLRVPDDPVVLSDLQQVRRAIGANGQVKYQAARTALGHADRFWALALAVYAATRELEQKVDGLRLSTPTPQQARTGPWLPQSGQQAREEAEDDAGPGRARERDPY